MSKRGKAAVARGRRRTDSGQSHRGRARSPPPGPRRSGRSAARTSQQKPITPTPPAGKSTRRTATSNRNRKRSSSASAAAKPEEHERSVAKKPAEETEIKNDESEVPLQKISAAGDDDKASRDQMTSSDPERGDNSAANGQQTCASRSADEAAKRATTEDGQTQTHAQAAVSSSDRTVSPTDRNSDKSEPETASSETPQFASDRHIAITCGENEAVMYLGARTSGKEKSRDRRVLFNGSWLTPNEFQTVSGRGAAKDWKRTVKHAGQCVKALLAARLLSIEADPAGCVCKHCTADTDTTVKCSSGDDALPTQSRDGSDVTSGLDVTTSSTPEVGSSVKGAARAKQKSGFAKRQSGVDAATGDVVSFVKDEKGDELKSSSSSVVTSLTELELAAAAGRHNNGKLDDVKASKFDHLNRVIAELKKTKDKLTSVETTPADSHSRLHVKEDAGVSVSSCSTSRLNITTQSHLATNRASDACSTSAAAAVATMPVMPFPGAFPAGFCGLSPAQLAPLQMYPPYIFMGFPLHPQLLQSYQVPTAEPLATYPSVNPAKRKSTQPMRAPRDEKMYRGSHTPTPTLQSVGHVAYLPIVTSPPAHDESRDRKHSVMTSSVDSRQGAREFDQDGALDLTKK